MTMKSDPHLEDALRELMVEDTMASSPPLDQVDPGLRKSFAETLTALTGHDPTEAAWDVHRAATGLGPAPRVSGGAGGHAYLRSAGRPHPAAGRHPRLFLGAGAAAAALLLLSIGVAVGLGRRDPGSGVAESPAIVGHDVYLGGGAAPAVELDVQTFTGRIDWSEVATESDMYEVTVKTEGKKYLDDHGIIYRSEEYIVDSVWICPTTLELPPRFSIEVRAFGPDSVEELVWSRRFLAPPSDSRSR